MAQGLLNSEEPELIGEDFFDELAARSFFQDFSVDEDGNTVFFKMHGLIHDLAQFLTNRCYISHYNDDEFCFDQENSSRPNHVSLIYDKPDRKPFPFHESIEKVCNLRTLQSMRCRRHQFQDGNLSSDLIRHLKCLRVLRLKRMGISHLPDEIDKLVHLRYLDLSHNEELRELPNSVCRLINLQTLKLKNCRGLRLLPAEMAGMVRLRNLDVRRCISLEYLPNGIRSWKYLQTLSTFIISGTREGCQIEELKYQNFLKGRLEINGLARLKAAREAAEAELHKKNQLSELLLDFGRVSGSRDVLKNSSEDALAVRALGVLRPHLNLKNLTICDYFGSYFPSWMGSTEGLRYLRCLNLNVCINCSELPALGLLPSLEVLGISQLSSLKHIGVEIYGGRQCNTQVAFPKLKTLIICLAPELEVWEFGNGQVQVGTFMPCVTTIHIHKCIKLKALPALGKLPSLQTLSIYESYKLVSIGHEFCGAGSSSLSSLTEFSKLNSLTCNDLYNLEVMNLGEMPCLKILDIKDCPRLKSVKFWTKSLSSLETLSLVEVINLEEFKVEEIEEENSIQRSWQQLPSLLQLHLQGCTNLKAFPHSLLRLRSFYAEECPSLMLGQQPYLPISPDLTSLRIDRDHSQLHLGYIADFTELQQLEIFGLPDNLFKEGDWSILSHIPDIIINNCKVDPLTYSSSSTQTCANTNSTFETGNLSNRSSN